MNYTDLALNPRTDSGRSFFPVMSVRGSKPGSAHEELNRRESADKRRLAQIMQRALKSPRPLLKKKDLSGSGGQSLEKL